MELNIDLVMQIATVLAGWTLVVKAAVEVSHDGRGFKVGDVVFLVTMLIISILISFVWKIFYLVLLTIAIVKGGISFHARKKNKIY